MQAESLIYFLWSYHAVPVLTLLVCFCSRKNKLHILVALDDEDEQGGKAEGELFWDDGDSIGNIYTI